MIVPILQEELFSAPMMFKLSAMINLVSVIGHTKYGYDYYYPCLNTITEKPANRLMKHGSSGVWNSVNATLFIAAPLNWQWAHTNGPATWTEQSIFWSLLFVNTVGGRTFFKIWYYQPMIPLCGATFFSVIGYLMVAMGRYTMTGFGELRK